MIIPSLTITPTKEQTQRSLWPKIQNDAETWGRFLNSSGGQLEFSKNSYSLMNWTFQNNGKPQLSTEHEPPANNVRLKDAHGEGSQLKRKQTNKGVKMLGVIKTCSMNDSKEFNYLLAHTKTYAKASIVCPLKPHEIWIGYRTIYNACISYPLSSTYFLGSLFCSDVGKS